MVHITDTRTQKVVSYTSAHITETVLAHDQHWENIAVYPLHSCIVAKAQKMDNRTVGHYTTGVSTCPALRRARPIPALLTFLCLVCTQCPHIFATQKQYWWDANSETIHRQLLHFFSIQECWIIEEKWRFVESIRHLKRSNKKVGWRCASYKNRYKLFLSTASKVLTQWLTWCGQTLTFLGM